MARSINIVHPEGMARVGCFSPTLCPLCDDWIVAPVTSEFVEHGEIRHLWECDTCGETTLATIDLVDL